MKIRILALAVAVALIGFSCLTAAEEAGAAGVKLYQYAQTVEQLSRSRQDISSNARTIEIMTKELVKDETIRGFGSMGGEEFFSYMNTSDSLRRLAASSLNTTPKDWSREPLGEHVEKGLKWLISVQSAGGGWGQDGGETAHVRAGEKLESRGNDIANTVVSTLALMRAGHTPTQGQYTNNVRKAVDFVLTSIERSQEDGLALATPSNTQIQRKLGPYIDTFMAAMLLAELDGSMGNDPDNARVRKALRKVIAKIEQNQGATGSWNGAGGWAPILGTSYCSRSLALAQKKGVPVNQSVMDKVQDWTKARAKETLAKTDAADVKAATPAIEVANNNQNPQAEKSPGADAWENWNEKITRHVKNLQNNDGTWSGQHCITGRVACTGAAVLTLLAERTPVSAKSEAAAN